MKASTYSESPEEAALSTPIFTSAFGISAAKANTLISQTVMQKLTLLSMGNVFLQMNGRQGAVYEARLYCTNCHGSRDVSLEQLQGGDIALLQVIEWAKNHKHYAAAPIAKAMSGTEGDRALKDI